MKDETIKTYDQVADIYKTYNHNPVRTWVNEMDWLVAQTGPGVKVLEVGCGTGVDIAELEKRFDYTGTDASSAMLELAKEYVSSSSKLKLMDMRSLQFAPGSFDALWCLATLLHIKKSELPKALTGINNVLKPGANGVITLKKKRDKDDGYEADDLYGGRRRYFSYYSVEEFSKYLEKAGFEVLDCYDVQARRSLWLCYKIRKLS